MPLNTQLLDVSVRTQVYIEDVKAWQNNKFNPILKDLSDNFKKVVQTSKYEDLNKLSKAELTRLIAKLRISQSIIYNAYYEKILIDLKEFMKASLEVNQRTYWSIAANKNKDKAPEAISQKKSIELALDKAKNTNRNETLFGVAAITTDDAKLWAAITNEPLPVNGVYLIAYIKTFIAASQAALENLIRKAWANKWTVQQLIAQGTAENPQETPQGNSSETRKISINQTAVIATIMQHIAQQVQAGVTSLLFDAYKWISIIDGKTSDICRGLNLTKWAFGKGPFPPAHVHCRSHISPIVGIGDIPEETFYTWINRQSEVFQKDVLGAANARALRDGKIKPQDISKYESIQQLSLEGFKSKVETILTI